jgi:hypothetical protein
MSDKAFPRDTHLTSISIAYKNPDVNLIADSALPRVQVGKKSFGYYSYPLDDGYNIPDTRVGEYSKVQTSKMQGTRTTSECEDYGHGIPLSADDISEAPQGVDPRERATERATNIVLLDREKRCADLIFNAASYPASNKTTLAGATQLNTTTVNPIAVLRTGLGLALIRPNVVAMGQEVWDVLSVHPNVVSACIGNSGQYGVATKERVAELLEISELLVGASLANSVKPGKTPVLTRLWGKHILGFYRDRTVDTSGGVTFGITAQFGQRIAGSQNIDIGLRGGVEVRAGETVKELIVAPRACYFWENAVA